MKISLKWLEKYIEVKDFIKNPALLAEALTDAGLEVESILKQSDALQDVVVGKIEKLIQHPDADRLTCCDVSVSDGETVKIVCGAKNHKEGDKVCVALVGAVLPGDFKIKKSKIRGQESFGMLCSKKELGFAEESKDGILILPKDARVGQEISEYLAKDDVVLEINVTPNRADCLSHLGLAREIGVLFKRPLHTNHEYAINTYKKSSELRSIKISLDDSEQCPRYMGCMVYNVKVGPSPQWLKDKLETLGLSSINNVVDITNYIMMDTGQPLHAFDADQIKGESLFIRRAVKGESFKSLDASEYKLKGEELVIADKSEVLALAGVVGGQNSGVSEKTTSVFLEAAYFTPETVRKTARSFGIDTDSAHRFSRGVDPSGTDKAMKQALFLLQDLSSGEVSTKVYEEYPSPVSKKEIFVSLDFLEKKTGLSLESKMIESIFDQLGFQMSNSDKKNEWSVVPSLFRHDVSIKEDLAEEVARLIGYNNIPEVLPAVVSPPQSKHGLYENCRSLKTQCVGLGFSEVIHHNFYATSDEKKWHSEIKKIEFFNRGGDVSITNPLSLDSSLMRASLIPQFVSNSLRNFRAGRFKGSIFEFGKSHSKVEEGFSEKNILSFGSWDKEQTQDEIHTSLISVVSKLFNLWGIKNFRFEPLDKNSESNVLHPKLTANIIAEGKTIGVLYALHPAVLKNLKLSVSFSGLELDLDLFLKGQPRPKKFKEFSRYPLVERDFSITLNEDFDYASIEKQVKKDAKNYFKSLSVVEEYRDSKIGENKVSLTLRGLFQAQDKTLGEEEVKVLHKNVLQGLRSFEEKGG